MRDGVTTSFELELGVADIDTWYGERADSVILNYGASIGHARIRMAVMNDPGSLIPIGDAKHRPATKALSSFHAGLGLVD